MRKIRVVAIAAAVALPASILSSTFDASFAATKGGTIRIWISDATKVTVPIVITGVIGDYGTSTSQDKNGKPDINGNYEKVVLKKGSFLVNASALTVAMNKAPFTTSATNCSTVGSGTATATIYGGTGAYKGIKGTLTITLTVAGVGPKLKSGKCDESENSEPLAAYTSVTGSGTVSYS